MKRIIPLIAVAAAMAVPITLSAENYYGYDNANKAIPVQWVVDAIDAGDVTFTTTQAKEDFLDLCDDTQRHQIGAHVQLRQVNWRQLPSMSKDQAIRL